MPPVSLPPLSPQRRTSSINTDSFRTNPYLPLADHHSRLSMHRVLYAFNAHYCAILSSLFVDSEARAGQFPVRYSRDELDGYTSSQPAFICSSWKPRVPATRSLPIRLQTGALG